MAIILFLTHSTSRSQLQARGTKVIVHKKQRKKVEPSACNNQGRRSRCGGRRTNNMLCLASKLLNLAVSSQDCTRNDLRRSKIQKFSEGGPPRPPYVTRFARLPCFLVGALRAQLRRHDFIAQSALHLTKLKLLPTGLMMKLMCMHSENA